VTVLVVAERDHHALKSDTLRAVMAACQISMFSDGQIHVLVVGVQAGVVAEQAVRINGVSKVLVADAQQSGATNSVAAHILRIAGAYSHILFSATAAGRGAARSVAAALDVSPIEQVTRVISPDTFEQQNHALPASQARSVLSGVKVVTVCANAFEAASAQGGIGHIEYLTQVLPMSGIDLGFRLSTGWGFAVQPGPFAAESNLVRHQTNVLVQGVYSTRGAHKLRQRAIIGQR